MKVSLNVSFSDTEGFEYWGSDKPKWMDDHTYLQHMTANTAYALLVVAMMKGGADIDRARLELMDMISTIEDMSEDDDILNEIARGLLDEGQNHRPS